MARPTSFAVVPRPTTAAAAMENTGSSATSLAPGFRFHPTDEELVSYYLKRKVTNKSARFNAIAEVDIYRHEPWNLSGTLDKCKACDKTVHVVDMMTLEGIPYHKTCFKCSHCKGKLEMSTYSSMDGVLYCMPHFEQLFKESGNFSKNFQPAKQNDQYSRTPNKLSSLFSGTQDKCAACEKTVYPLEKITMEGECFHKTCFRCAHGGCPLTHSSYAALDSVLYCKHHFAQLFLVKGNFNHVLESATHKRNSSAAPSAESAENQADPDATAANQDDSEETS